MGTTHELEPLFPAENQKIGEVLKMDLPAQSHTLDMTKRSVWFGRDAHHTDVSYLKNRPLLEARLLAKLKEHMPQMWMDGMQLVVYPRYNDGRDRLPLDVMKFWAGMKGVTGEKETEKEPKRWLDQVVKKLQGEKHKSESEVREAQRLLGELEWKTGLRADEVVTTDFIFPQLLGDEWISGDLVHFMINCIAERLESSGNPDGVMIYRGARVCSSDRSLCLRHIRHPWPRGLLSQICCQNAEGRQTTPVFCRQREPEPLDCNPYKQP